VDSKKNSKKISENLKSYGFTKIDSIKTYYFATLYTTISHNKLKSRLLQIISISNKNDTQNKLKSRLLQIISISNKNDTQKYKILVIWKQDTYFVRHHCDSPFKYSSADIKDMIGFVVDNIYVVFGYQVF
jgi:nitrate reductase beta subunit